MCPVKHEARPVARPVRCLSAPSPQKVRRSPGAQLPAVEELTIDDRAADFRRFVVEDVARRRAVEDAFIAEAAESNHHP